MSQNQRLPYSKNPLIRTSTSKNLKPEMILRDENSLLDSFFSVILEDPIENDCLDKEHVSEHVG